MVGLIPGDRLLPCDIRQLEEKDYQQAYNSRNHHTAAAKPIRSAHDFSCLNICF
jgi:hypothetical protein